MNHEKPNKSQPHTTELETHQTDAFPVPDAQSTLLGLTEKANLTPDPTFTIHLFTFALPHKSTHVFV